jgi:tRNA-Thr(GGU) m(6)t(6)A37 methyltransferase TsaA
MENTTKPIVLHPIGYVKNDITQTPSQRNWQLELISDLVIDHKWIEGLEGLEEYSHIIILFWFHKVKDNEVILKIHPMHRMDLPVTGFFATRTYNRPNRIGETVVKLIERRGNIVRVKGLDALDGTPVLDIKPYLRNGDFIPDARGPIWTHENPT